MAKKRQKQQTKDPVVRLEARKGISTLLIVLFSLEVLWVLGDIFMNRMALIEVQAIRNFWNIAREDGVASWFGTTQTWMVGLTALALYFLYRRDGGRKSGEVGWLIVAIGFLFLAMDDGSEFHERVGTWFKQTSGDTDGRGVWFFPSYTWQLVFLPILGVFGVYLVRFTRRILDREDWHVVLLSLALLALAIAIDFTEGLEIDHPLNVQGWMVDGFGWDKDSLRHYAKAAEEFIEMAAWTIMWSVLLRHIVDRTPRFRVELDA